MVEYTIKTTTSGRPAFVRSQSCSTPKPTIRHHHLSDHIPHLHRDHTFDGVGHHHLIDHILPHDHYYRVEYHRRDKHHHHHHARRKKCPTNCACITVDEWANLVKQNRNYATLTANLTDSNTKLKKEVGCLTDAKAALEAEHKSLQVDHKKLQTTAQQLSDDNAELRRCLALAYQDDGSSHAIIDRLRRRIKDQSAELQNKDGLIAKLEKSIGDLRGEIKDLKHKLKHKSHHDHHIHLDCDCHHKKNKSCDNASDAGSDDSSSTDNGGVKISRRALKAKIAELRSALDTWRRRSESLQKISLEFESRADRAERELVRQTELADRFRRKIHRLEDQLGCRERGVWFG